MRISDWSSDVCSSDLAHLRTEITVRGGVDVDVFLVVLDSTKPHHIGTAAEEVARGTSHRGRVARDGVRGAVQHLVGHKVGRTDFDTADVMLFDEQVGFVDLVAFGRAFQLDTAADNGAVVENRADVEPDFRIRRRKGGSRLINLLDTAVLKLGSASCRERGGQDVEISVGAGSLKKKTHQTT